MKLIGLAGPVGVGKDTIADYLVLNYNFSKFSFSDPLYEEVAAAFGIDKAVLYERSTKETPLEALQYWYCKDKTFQNLMFHLLVNEGQRYAMDVWVSPRWVLQRWGTDYRRAQDPEYWVKKAKLYIQAYLSLAASDPETERGGLVNCSVRFENERATIEDAGGEIWHVKRDDWNKNVEQTQAAYVSEQGLVVLPRDKVIVNNGTIEQLGTAATLLLASPGGANIVCEPMVTAPTIVACKHCQSLLRGITLAEARQEIAEYNEWYDLQSDEAQKATPAGYLHIEDFECCPYCAMERGFRPATSDEIWDAIRRAASSVPFMGPDELFPVLIKEEK